MSGSALIEQLMHAIPMPILNVTLQETGVRQSVEGNTDSVKISLQFGFPIDGLHDVFTTAIMSAIHAIYPACNVTLTLSSRIHAHVTQAQLKPVPGVKNIIAVGSAKGGVGKSTTALNLAMALHLAGARVGMLDADIYGPNQPHMLGKRERPEADASQHLLPVMQYGLQTMSIGYLIDPEAPAVWRGPMVTKALQQLLFETRWSDLDYLIVDLPPGTGDIQLTLAQKVPVSGAVVVTTPQTVACLDAAKGIALLEKMAVPVLGVIENMSYHVCDCCGAQAFLFGQGGGRALAEAFHVPFLGELPLQSRVREQADLGVPIVSARPDDSIVADYRAVAWRLAWKLSLQARNYQGKFPDIVVQSV